jgi:hypothetical protein
MEELLKEELIFRSSECKHKDLNSLIGKESFDGGFMD